MIEEYECYEMKLHALLSNFLKPHQIDKLINLTSEEMEEWIKNNNIKLNSKTTIQSIINATQGLRLIRSLLSRLNNIQDDIVSSNTAAELSQLAFLAGILIGSSDPKWASMFQNKEFSEKGTTARYSTLTSFKESAARIARKMWEEGSDLQHTSMVKYLINEYEEDGKHPFMFLPYKTKSDDGPRDSDRVLNKVVKKVLYDLDREDLIKGL
jgi:hypothetical protein